MLNNPHLSARGVELTYQGGGGRPPLKALGPIDLDIANGEFFSIVGPSGCGKSTFLNVMAGMTSPTEGSISFEGKPVDAKVPDGVGIVFQEDSSFPWLTVFDNTAFGLRRQKIAENEVRTRVQRVLSLVGLTDFADAYPVQLSGGMRQRVCIARTLVMRPRLIVLDEPFGALDQQTRLLMGDELLQLWRETGATILLITHSLDEAVLLSDRIGVMSARPGRFLDIVSTGWPRDRDSRMASAPEFGEMTGRLWSLLRDESIKSMKVRP
jgi:NitT/TauT family transport system ATP-binding protein